MSTFVGVKEAASRLNLSVQQVRNLCRSGRIFSEKIGNIWLIEKDILEKHYDNNTCGLAEDQAPFFSKERNSGYKTLSFFSGAMGLDCGLEAEGFDILLASEIDNACRKTITKNKPNISLIGNIEDYKSDEIKLLAGLEVTDDIDLIVGGPPCQAFSTAGKRKGFDDKRGNVFLSFINLIVALRPKYAVIENVRGLLSATYDTPSTNTDDKQTGSAGSAVSYIVSILEANGYGVSFNLYNTANFGTPQKRERVVIVCARDGKKPPYLSPTNSQNGEYGLPKWHTLKDAIGELPNDKHTFIPFPEKRLKYYRMLSAGQNWRSLPLELQKEALGASFYSGGGKTGFLRRLSWEEPSPTLVTHPAMPATDLAHPVLDRPLSIEEYRKIQEFQEGWVFEGSMIEQYRQIGNAVPNSLGRAIGRLIRGLIENDKIDEYQGFQYSRYLNTSDHEWQQFRLFEKSIPILIDA